MAQMIQRESELLRINTQKNDIEYSKRWWEYLASQIVINTIHYGIFSINRSNDTNLF